MMRLYLALPVVAALALVACGDESEQSEIPELNEYDSPVPQAPAEQTATVDEPTDLTPAQETTQALSEAADAVTDAAQTVASVAVQQLNQLSDGQTVGDAAQELGTVARGFAEQIGEQASEGAGGAAVALSVLVGEAANAAEEAAQALEQQVANGTTAVDWQSTYSAEVPFYNLSDTAVMAYAQPDPDAAIVGEVAPGSGGFIQTCNETLDWCLLPLGDDDQTGWVDMRPFGGVAN